MTTPADYGEPWTVFHADANSKPAEGMHYVDIQDAGGNAIPTLPAWCGSEREFKRETPLAVRNRIVACVNACRGIPTELLQQGGESCVRFDFIRAWFKPIIINWKRKE